MRKILGIDPGLSGGLVVLDETGKVLFKEPIPVIEIKKEVEDKKKPGKFKVRKKTFLDLVGLNRIFEQVKDVDHAIIESVGAATGQGVTSVFTFVTQTKW
jgi:crossover junction endodeoxyribonuclease RuvC